MWAFRNGLGLEVPTVTTVRAKMKDALLKMVFVHWGSNIQRQSYTGRGKRRSCSECTRPR